MERRQLDLLQRQLRELLDLQQLRPGRERLPMGHRVDRQRCVRRRHLHAELLRQKLWDRRLRWELRHVRFGKYVQLGHLYVVLVLLFGAGLELDHCVHRWSSGL